MLPSADSPRMGRGRTPSRALMLFDATSGIASRITGAVRSAAQATGASFDYLLKTAQRESNFNPEAKAATSSASGLFQFIEQTWLQTLKTSGPSLGYAEYADSIERTASGRYVVSNPADRQAILALRNDPAAASAMAGAFTQSNAAMLSSRLGRQPTEGELYIAHFLGPAGAVQLISAAENNPRANAADLFPQAARANRSVFYRGRNAPRSVAEVYDSLVAKHQAAGGPTSLSAAPKAPASPQTPAAIVAARWPQAQDPAATELAGPPASFSPDRPAFHQLFQTPGAAPVSAFVSELWGAGSVHNPARIAAAASPPAVSGATTRSKSPGRPLELFQFLRPDIRARTRGAA